ncbi:nucleoside triphosphate pyrophosphohydrolase [Shewanella sp. WXL01]|uniref:Nucleoside triphosphate pyrophosphohydrolase n=1 Tax=Shewanella maritima TaxID=2520507 RepID=A0A411PF40_9GAMM|nr:MULTISPECIES: nucleoside triphosphate pyrophosphohydrolase [Shewanella]NKF49759.1 nucleoside triphosphate pyrophosphohydrolase [Shewanella sp. WXL01]QBF82163.1 nucleoside triphosphate pyrophosphohydrolase [Shewanella maritima]
MANANKFNLDVMQPLLDIMAKLRDPKTGCPWDKQQTFETIVPFTLEEAYEVADAIEQADFESLPDELGDLLFQVVFYCQLGREQGMFDFADVVERICNKLTRRHPHVFNLESDTPEQTANQVKQSWEQIKQQERSAKQQTSLLDDIPQALPSLNRAVKIQKRVSKVGFDWPTLEPVVDKVKEEIDEVLHEVKVNDQPKVAEEMGDLLFAVANMARHLGVDPEQALRQANRKFETRFRGVELLAAQSGKCMSAHTLEELDAYWDNVKSQQA